VFFILLYYTFGILQYWKIAQKSQDFFGKALYLLKQGRAQARTVGAGIG
jgi:hypothetical protein